MEPDQPLEFELRVRIPGWARGEVMPGGLYRYASQPAEPFTLTVNGKTVDSLPQQGYAVIRRTWQKGDTILLDLPMKIRRVLAGEKLENNRGRVALERGPLVYCAESVDTIENIRALVLPDEAVLDSRWQAGLLGGVMVLTGTAREIRRGEEGDQLLESQCPFQAIPYYAWAHRGTGQMEVWLARQASAAVPIPAPTLATSSRASASHVWSKDTVEAMHDQLEPANSHDTTQPRHTWWDHKGTREWVQYDFPQPVSVDSVEVYWFDDSGSGACRVPASWRLLYNDGSQWQEVAQPDSYTTTKDQFNQTRFTPVLTGGLRIEAQLQEGFSGGILEWIVHSASAKK
ncbi:MAG: Non-reducing end beta-L-arabinofuranosidase [Planctomycetes bacterium ADurb.Bin412]|nr:MAG: Non-reducing end beta-L-arabinofuranosidase [Planctomycetes bacterium ADurb.Bin412]